MNKKVLSLLVFILPLTAYGQSVSDLVALNGNSNLALSTAPLVGHHDPASMLDVIIALKLHHPDQMQAFLEDLQNPASPDYHRFLSTQEFMTRFGPTSAQVSAVKAFLERRGLKVSTVSRNNTLIHVQASSSEVETAFDVQINDYLYNGRKIYGTLDNPKFSGDTINDIQAVIGLSDIIQIRPMSTASTNQSAVPLSYPFPVGYSPQQIETAYDWPSLTDTANGTGVTIAIVTFESPNLLASDYQSFWSYYGLPSHTVTVIPVLGGVNVLNGQKETTVDIEYAGAMAPGADIEVYDGLDSDTMKPYYGTYLTVFDRVVNDNNAQVVTTSWGFPEGDLVIQEQGWVNNEWLPLHNLLAQAAAQGMSVIAAAGDCGSSDDCNNPGGSQEADYPSSDTYVLAAGGTTVTLNGDNTIASETAWNNTGGAISMFIDQPEWQAGPGVPQNGMRNTTDLSMSAFPGYSFYFNGAWVDPYHGTSIVAPQLAGLFAIRMSRVGTALGEANSALYLDANGHYSSDFHDIVSGSNGTYSAGYRWDHPTGWGSPDATNLIAHLGSDGISPPVDMVPEYTQCRNGSDKYIVTWASGSLGTPTAYDGEYEYTSEGVWRSFYYGGLTLAHITLQPGAHVGIRVRATDGSVWSDYNTDIFYTAPCTPAP